MYEVELFLHRIAAGSCVQLVSGGSSDRHQGRVPRYGVAPSFCDIPHLSSDTVTIGVHPVFSGATNLGLKLKLKLKLKPGQ